MSVKEISEHLAIRKGKCVLTFVTDKNEAPNSQIVVPEPDVGRHVKFLSMDCDPVYYIKSGKTKNTKTLEPLKPETGPEITMPTPLNFYKENRIHRKALQKTSNKFNTEIEFRRLLDKNVLKLNGVYNPHIIHLTGHGEQNKFIVEKNLRGWKRT
eukprot:UN30030